MLVTAPKATTPSLKTNLEPSPNGRWDFFFVVNFCPTLARYFERE